LAADCGLRSLLREKRSLGSAKPDGRHPNRFLTEAVVLDERDSTIRFFGGIAIAGAMDCASALKKAVHKQMKWPPTIQADGTLVQLLAQDAVVWRS
jgi:hypothetical protein